MTKVSYAPCFDCQTKLRPPYKHTITVVRTSADAQGKFFDLNTKEPLCTPCHNKRTQVSPSA